VVVALAIAGVLATSTLAPVQGIAKDAMTDASKSEEKSEIGKVTVLTQVPPEYPELAREADLEAFVFARITVDSDLKVVDASVEGMYVGKAPLERTDFNIKEAKKQLSLEDDLTAYRKTFAQATIDAVLQWKIRVEPAGSAGQGVEMVVPVQFKLDADDAKETKQNDR